MMGYLTHLGSKQIGQTDHGSRARRWTIMNTLLSRSMSPMSTFPGETVISSFSHVELMFDNVLRHIPYVSEHEDVWSPSLVTVLMEACSQLDSLWKYKVTNSPNAILPPSSENLNITHYFQNLGKNWFPNGRSCRRKREGGWSRLLRG